MEASKYDILYIDDEQDNLDVFESCFWRDYNLHLASSAYEALEILEKQRVHLIITDQRMPVVTGVEFLEKIVDKYPEPVRLLLTGYSDLDSIVDAINKGKIFHYITKPWRKSELKRTLDNALETFRLKEENQLLLQKLQINNKKLNDLNLNLEQKVKERTEELDQKNKKLNKTLSQLKNTQSQLIESEKLASLGMLSAVLGHEITSPIAVVKGSLDVIKEIINKSSETANKLLELDAKKSLTISGSKKKIDLTVLSDLQNKAPGLIDYSLDGVNLILDIVRSMKIFIGSKTSEYQEASIHEGIDSTVLLLRSTLRKSNISVIKDYDSAIKKIKCFPGLLNQVFMNLFSNAIDAINVKEKRSGNISVKTSLDKTAITIKIMDNGVGIPPSVKNNIFDEFFTTKPQGSGIGLGMSIAKTIIEKHEGTIKVNSKLNHGTTFVIKLPVHLITS